MKCPKCGHEFEDEFEEIGFTEFPISLKDMRKIAARKIVRLLDTEKATP